jgi:DNA-binding response OmpR family regulator
MPDAAAILLLEADAITHELYQRELGQYYRVLSGHDVADALSLLKTTDIRAIVMEPEWADGEGWHFLTLLRHTVPQSSIPVIICSVVDNRRAAYELGVAAYFVKPVLPTTLVLVLRQVLASGIRSGVDP